MSKEISRRQFLVGGSGLAVAFFVGCENARPEQKPSQTLRPTPDPPSTHALTPSPSPIGQPFSCLIEKPSLTEEPTQTPQATPQPTLEEIPQPTAELAQVAENPQFEISTRPETLSEHFTALKESLTGEIQNFSGDAAIVISDLNDGETVSINGNVKHLTGCTINIFPFLSVLEDLQNGKYQLDDDLTYNLVQGIPLSQPRFVVPLLIKSGRSFEGGIAKANELRERIGAKNSIMDHEPLYGGPESGNNYFTAEDANLVLSKLYGGQILNPEWTAFAIDILTQTNYTVDYIIPAGIPQGARVAHKIGWHWDPTGWVYNDMGLVIAENDGRKPAFAISFFSQYGSYEGSGSRLGAELAQITWQHFAQKYNLS